MVPPHDESIPTPCPIGPQGLQGSRRHASSTGSFARRPELRATPRTAEWSASQPREWLPRTRPTCAPPGALRHRGGGRDPLSPSPQKAGDRRGRCGARGRTAETAVHGLGFWVRYRPLLPEHAGTIVGTGRLDEQTNLHDHRRLRPLAVAGPRELPCKPPAASLEP